MSQNGDYNLANQSGANFRAELNGILEDVKTMNSRNVEPSNPLEGELWYNTNTNVVSIYDGTSFVNLWDTDSATWVGTINIALNSVGIPQLGAGTPTAGQVLIANTSTTIDWQDAPGFPSGTRIVFQTLNGAAPTGWTTVADSTIRGGGGLRVVTGGALGTGGTADWTNPTHTLIGGAHTLTNAQVPSHSHKVAGSEGGGGIDYGFNFSANNFSGVSGGRNSEADTSTSGDGGSHTHPVSGSITQIKYTDVFVAQKD